jgi:Domain of unknown function (DUF1835)/Protein of unknown function
MFHIIFESDSIELLSAAMDIDQTLDGEIVLISDDYSVGPIEDLFTVSGRQHRNDWWLQINAQSGKESIAGKSESCTDNETIQAIVKRMSEEEFDEIWIWIAPNAKDVSGYYWLVSQLKNFAGRIFVLSLNNLPFINEKGAVFYPSTLAEIPAREFVKAKKLVRAVSIAEFETDPDEWVRLGAENKNLRILEGGKKLIQKTDDYFDKSLSGFLQPAFQKISRILHTFLSKSNTKPNDVFLQWRLRQLNISGIAEQQGDTLRQLTKTADEVNG